MFYSRYFSTTFYPCCLAGRLMFKLFVLSSLVQAATSYFDASTHTMKPVVPPECKAQLAKFGVMASIFTECALVHSFNGTCIECADEYAHMEMAYDAMNKENNSVVTPASEPCINWFKHSAMDYVDAVHKSLTTAIWENSFCNQCVKFDGNGPTSTDKFNITDDALYMMGLSYTFDECFISNLFSTNGSVCKICQPEMHVINQQYRDYMHDHMEDADLMNYCIDVRLKLNESWHMWEQHNCSLTRVPINASSIISLAICACVLVSVVIFYLGFYMQAEREQMRRFRKYMVMDEGVSETASVRDGAVGGTGTPSERGSVNSRPLRRARDGTVRSATSETRNRTTSNLG